MNASSTAIEVGVVLAALFFMHRMANAVEISTAANLIDDGSRLWLVDWEYGGFNSPLFDLGGLASNNELSPSLEERLLELYFEQPVSDDLRRRYHAMKCASLLREAMWSMVSEIHLTIDFDYHAYTAGNLARFEQAYESFQAR